MAVKERDPYLCAAGSFFFPGLGQVYCGRMLRGIVFLVPAVILTIPFVVPLYWTPLMYWSNFLYKMIDFFVRVIATYDAYNVAKLTKTP